MIIFIIITFVITISLANHDRLLSTRPKRPWDHFVKTEENQKKDLSADAKPLLLRRSHVVTVMENISHCRRVLIP